MVPGFALVCFFHTLFLSYLVLLSGPNELSVNLPSAIRPIYAQMFRAPAYQGLVIRCLSNELSLIFFSRPARCRCPHHHNWSRWACESSGGKPWINNWPWLLVMQFIDRGGIRRLLRSHYETLDTLLMSVFSICGSIGFQLNWGLGSNTSISRYSPSGIFPRKTCRAFPLDCALGNVSICVVTLFACINGKYSGIIWAICLSRVDSRLWKQAKTRKAGFKW